MADSVLWRVMFKILLRNGFGGFNENDEYFRELKNILRVMYHVKNPYIYYKYRVWTKMDLLSPVNTFKKINGMIFMESFKGFLGQVNQDKPTSLQKWLKPKELEQEKNYSNIKNVSLEYYDLDLKVFPFKGLTRLVFGDPFNKLLPEKLPPTLLELEMGRLYNQPHDFSKTRIMKLVFSFCFNQPIKGKLPKTLMILILGALFNQDLVDLGTPLLEKITVGNNFNKSLNFLPPSIMEITAGNNYDTPLIVTYPKLTYLNLGNKYNSFMADQPSLHELHIGHVFNQYLMVSFENLEVLNLGWNFNQCISTNYKNLKKVYFSHRYNWPFTITETMEEVSFGSEYNQPVEFKESLKNPQLRVIKFSFYYNLALSIPKNFIHLTEIVFGDRFNQSVDNLPSCVTHLTFALYFNQAVDHLPSNLTHLTIAGTFNQPVDHLPSTLTHLDIFGHFDQPVDHLPRDLIVMKLRGDFNQGVDHLPSNLVKLLLDGKFNQPVDYLPSSLRYLSLGRHFDQPLDYLPRFLWKLDITGFFNHPLDHLPSELKVLGMYNIYNFPNFERFTKETFDQPLDHLPSSLCILNYEIHHNAIYHLHNLPEELTYLNVASDRVDFTIPPNLKYLACPDINACHKSKPPQLIYLGLVKTWSLKKKSMTITIK